MTISLAEKRKRRFVEFSEEPPPLAGSKIKIDDIINEEIEVINYRIGVSKFTDKDAKRQYLTLQIKRENGQLYIVFTGSSVLIRQADKYAGFMPFITTIRKINRHYTFT